VCEYRGNDFRPDYKTVCCLRSVFCNVPIVCLSATVTQSVYNDVLSKLQLTESDVSITAIPPDRPNIYLEVKRQSSYDIERDLQWVVEDLKAKKQTCDKTIIFAQSINEVSRIYIALLSSLGTDAYVDGIKDPQRRMLSMFHGEIDEMLCTAIYHVGIHNVRICYSDSRHHNSIRTRR